MSREKEEPDKKGPCMSQHDKGPVQKGMEQSTNQHHRDVIYYITSPS